MRRESSIWLARAGTPHDISQKDQIGRSRKKEENRGQHAPSRGPMPLLDNWAVYFKIHDLMGGEGSTNQLPYLFFHPSFSLSKDPLSEYVFQIVLNSLSRGQSWTHCATSRNGQRRNRRWREGPGLRFQGCRTWPLDLRRRGFPRCIPPLRPLLKFRLGPAFRCWQLAQNTFASPEFAA